MSNIPFEHKKHILWLIIFYFENIFEIILFTYFTTINDLLMK